MNPQKTRWLWLGAAGMTATLLTGCHGGGGAQAALPPKPAESQGASVRVGTPLARLEGSRVTATGTLRARREATLSAPASGTIKALKVEVGDVVKEGQPLVLLDATNAALTVEQAQAAASAAQVDVESVTLTLERTRTLAAADGTSKAELDRVEAGYKQAQAGLARAKAAAKQAEHNLSEHVLRAPFNGTVTARFGQVGEEVTAMPPTRLISLVDTAAMEVRLNVPETVVDAVSPGMTVEGTVSPSGRGFSAKVRTVGATVDAASRTVEVLLDVTKAEGVTLRSGALVQVAFTEPARENGPFLPANALQSDTSGSFVWLVDNGVAKRRLVKTQPLTPDTVRVVEGLTGTERVVLMGAATLREGAAVRSLD
ncbi:efflux RND transporter periplasmic adaptor subunit [Myxococcaceae bacterium GXIMD 01537]